MKQSKGDDGAMFSVRTKDATEGGGTEGAHAVIKEIGWVDEFTYGGRQKDKPQAALRCEYEIEGFDKPWEQHYTAGPTEKYVVVADGDGIRSAGKARGLNKKCSAYRFFEALEEAAGDDIEALLPVIEGENAQSIRALEGRSVILTNVKFETVSGDIKDLVVIGSLEEADAKPAKGGSKSGKMAAAATADTETKTEEAVNELIEEHTSVKRGDLSNLIYAAHKKEGDVKAMMQLCFKDAWVADNARPWSFDKKKGILRAAD
jgi:hypothetical protein